MSGDPEQEYFSDGITEDIITDLSKISGLHVLARNTVFTYKGKPVKVQQVARELGVKFVLEGSVRKAGQRVRITGQLIDGADGGHVWADRYDRELTDIFAIQDEITHTIVDQLKVKLLPAEKKAIKAAPTDNVEAYTYYLRGREFFHRTSKTYYVLAKRMFGKAIVLDPLYARAYAGIADCDSFLFLNYDEKVSLEAILANSGKALDIESGLAEAHASRCLALSVGQRYEEAEKEFEQAIAINPNLFEAHYFYARALLCRKGSSIRQPIFSSARPKSSPMTISPSSCLCKFIILWGGRKRKGKRHAEALNGPSGNWRSILRTPGPPISVPPPSPSLEKSSVRRNGPHERWQSIRTTS